MIKKVGCIIKIICLKILGNLKTVGNYQVGIQKRMETQDVSPVLVCFSGGIFHFCRMAEMLSIDVSTGR